MTPAFRGAIALALLAFAAGSPSALANDYGTPIVRPSYTNVATFSTTTTTASPTFNRPAISLGTVTPAPLSPSGIGTNVGYAAQGFTAGDTGQYRVTTAINSGYAASDAAGSSNLVQVLYQGAFDPTDKKFTNGVLAYNPPGTTGSYTTNLTGGQDYTFVNGGRYNIDKTGGQLSLGTVTTSIDKYDPGSFSFISQADTLQRPGVATQTINLTGGGPVTSFNSLFIAGLSQAYLGGLTATLTHDGVSVNLFDRTGANASNYFQGSSANFDGSDYYFTDTGADLAAAAAAAEPPAGSFADPGSVAGGSLSPYKSLNSLSAFDGLGLSGAWTLTIQDFNQGDDGSFLGFSFNADSPQAAAVPEASTWVGLGLGLLALVPLAVRRRRAARAS